MNEIRYIISDASKRVDVEPHVLRYWEEELDLDIPRNEMGHRYYREEDLNTLKTIKQLKEQGFQLRAIKMILPDITNIEKLDAHSILKLRKELNEKVNLMEDVNLIMENKQQIQPSSLNASTEKMTQFKNILQGIVSEAIKENSSALTNTVSTKVSENVLKEMDYLFREKEDKDEERFKRLDETIRAYQKVRQEVAVSEVKDKKFKKNFFSKKSENRNYK